VAAIALVLVSVLVGAGSLVGRFRRARGVERQQLRWLALAAVQAAGLLLVGLVAGYLGQDAVVLASLTLGVALLPLATGAAILRYRLYDLDRIVSRAVAYGLLTVLLGGGYALVVLGWASCWAATPAWPWPRPPWPWRRCSSRPAGGSRSWWSGASTAAATTPPAPSAPSAPACATRSTWTTCAASC
jgi:hypothetical protein